MKHLGQYIAKNFSQFSVNTVFACLRGKNYQAMLKLVERFSSHTIITEIRGKRGLKFNDMDTSVVAKFRYVANAQDIFQQLQSQPSEGKLNVVCGSFALVEEIRELLRGSDES